MMFYCCCFFARHPSIDRRW